MPNTSDAQLLREYAAHGSEPAFAALVARHTDLVYSAALRQTGSPELAREIAQGVFTDLARKARALAGTLAADASLAGWLFRGTRFAAQKRLRDDHRRQSRERQFMEHFNPATDAAPGWEQIAPVLDEAMAELDDADREAVLLRYFQNLDYAAVGRALGISDDTAQKRVTRAVERLRDLLVKRGVTTGTSGLALLITTNAVLVAPAGLSAALTATIFTTTTATLAHATLITMNWLNTKSVAAIVSAALLAGTGTYWVQQQRLAEAEARQRELLAQQTQLAATRDTAFAASPAQTQDAARRRQDASDLARLRNEVTQLRQQLAAQKNPVPQPAAPPVQTPPVTHPPGTYIAKEQMSHVGFATPETALETITYVMMTGTYDQVSEAMGKEFAEDEKQNPKGREEFAERQKKIAPLFQGLQILAKKTLPDGRIELKIRHAYDPAISALNPERPLPEFMVQPMTRIGNEWRLGGSTRQHLPEWDQEGPIQTFTP